MLEESIAQGGVTMADNPIAVVWSLIEHVGHRAVDHGASWADRAAGFDPARRMMPGALPTMPTLDLPRPPTIEELMAGPGAPRLPALPSVSLPLAAAAGGAAGATAGLSGTAAYPQARQIAPERAQTGPSPSGTDDSLSRAEKAPPRPPEGASADTGLPDSGWSYSDEVEGGIACANCLRKHLGAVVAEAEKAQERAAAGDDHAAREHMARAAAELAVLERYDLTPEKIASTPRERRGPVEASLPHVHHLRDMARAHTPDEMAIAWGAVDESVRFARSTRPTERDAQEVAVRLRDADAYAAFAERDLLGPEHVRDVAARLPEVQRQEALTARDHIRAAGHVLDRGNPMVPQTLEEASTELSVAAVALTVPPTPEDAQAFLSAAREAQRTFYREYLAMLSGGE